MMINKAPCSQTCDKRAELVKKYGNCHNEHCPYGWEAYDALRHEDYKDRLAKLNVDSATPNKEKLAHKYQMERKQYNRRRQR